MDDQFQPEQPSLDAVATPAFFPAILEFLRNTSPVPLPLDPVILQAILLCIIAGDKHLILQTTQEDVGLVVKLSLWILSVVFDFKTHKLKIRPRVGSPSLSTDPAPHLPFLRSLFIPRTSQHFYQDSQDENESLTARLKHPKPRHHKSKYKLPLDAPGPGPHSTAQRYRSPSPSPPTPRSHPAANKFFTSDNELSSHTRPTAYLLHKHSSSVSGLSHELPRALVISGLHHASTLSQRSLATVLAEKRVVLESSNSLPSHTLQEELDDGVWSLPEGFLVIYVCPFNGKERPAIHKSLLDKFAMSTNVVVDPAIRQAILAFSPSPNHSLSPTQSLPSSPLSTHHIQLSPTSPPKHAQPIPSTPLTPSTPSQFTPPRPPRPLLHPSFLKSLRTFAKNTYFSSGLTLYLADLMSATRHHPELDGTFITAKAHVDVEELSRAMRVLGVNPSGMELARYPSVEEQQHQQEEQEQEVGQGEEDFVSAEEGHGRDADAQTTGTIVPGAAASIAASSTIYQPSHARKHRSPSLKTAVTAASALPQLPHQQPPAASASVPVPPLPTPQPPLSAALTTSIDVESKKDVLNVTEADVARIVPRVVTHRLRVRDGPEDEIYASAVYGATFEFDLGAGREVEGQGRMRGRSRAGKAREGQEGEGETRSGRGRRVDVDEEWEKKSVKDILVKILVAV